MPPEDHYPAGSPCWIETWQPEPYAAVRFYESMFGWHVHEVPVTGPGSEDPDEYYLAHQHGQRVAGIGQAPEGFPAAWMMQVRVDDLDATIAHAEAAGGSCLQTPLDRGPEGRVAVLADAAGVPFGIREAAGAELVGESGTWAMTSLHSAEPRRAQRFYTTVFGWELHQGTGEPFSRWFLDGQVIGLLAAAEGDTPEHWSVNIAVDDADVTAERATALGGSAVIPPFDTPGFRNTVIADPQGGVLACSAPAS